MPKPSLNPEKAKQGGGVEPGNYEVTAAKFQNLKTDFKVNQPNLVLTCQVLDKDGDRIRGADSIDINFGFGAKSLEAFHPGKGSGPDDAEPEDMGDGVDVEGNTIYCVGDDQFNASCGAVVFNATLVKAGFPKSVLEQCWAGSYVGLEFALDTKSAKETNDRFGTRLNTKPLPDGGTVTYKICDKWLNPNYMSAKSSKKDAGAPAETNGNKPESVEDVAIAVLKTVAAQKPGEKNAMKSKQSLMGFCTNAFAKGRYKAKLGEVQALIKKDEWITGQLSELGAVLDYDEAGAWTGKVVFPE